MTVRRTAWVARNVMRRGSGGCCGCGAASGWASTIAGPGLRPDRPQPWTSRCQLMTSQEPPGPWTDLDRPPLREAALRSALVVDGSLWTDLRVLDEHRVDQRRRRGCRPGGRAGGAGRGRRGADRGPRPGRADLAGPAPIRAGVLGAAPPAVPARGLGLAAAARRGRGGAALRRSAGPGPGSQVAQRRPVDGERKLAGILAEVVGDAVVLGLGLNVSLRADELPVPTATSLAIEGSEVVDRDPVRAGGVARDRPALREYVTAGATADGPQPRAPGLRSAYRAACVTLGRDGAGGAARRREVSGGSRRRRPLRPAARARSGRYDERLAAGDIVHVR